MEHDLLDDIELSKKEIRKQRSWMIISLVVIQLLVFGGAFIGSVAEIETILISGPAMVIVSLFLFIVAIIYRRGWAIVLGVIGGMACVSVPTVIILFNLSKRESEGPIPWLILIYLVIASALSVVALIKEYRRS